MVAIGYVRVSTGGQVEDGVSLDAQREKVAAWAKLHDEDEVVIYEDAGTSGSSMEQRPGLQEDAEIAHDDDIQLFARINGVYNCWPYIREVVSSTFARLGYPPFTLDSLVIAPQPESSEAPAEA